MFRVHSAAYFLFGAQRPMAQIFTCLGGPQFVPDVFPVSHNNVKGHIQGSGDLSPAPFIEYAFCNADFVRQGTQESSGNALFGRVCGMLRQESTLFSKFD